MKNERGITLVALVITVIIMLILAGVAISMITGEDGLFARANHAASLYENASKTESEIVNKLFKNLNSIDFEESKKHYIYDKEDLEELRDNVNAGNSYKGEEVILMDDIDLKGNKEDEATWWKPVDEFDSDGMAMAFEGVFDGNDYSITGLYAEMYEGGDKTLSIFPHINDAEIKDLTIDGEFIVGENNDNANFAVAGLTNATTGNCKITNCKNSIDVEKLGTSREAAGLVGAVENGELTIENCCGGLVGIVYSKVVINNSGNTGNITNLYGNYVGGLIGRDGNKRK